MRGLQLAGITRKGQGHRPQTLIVKQVCSLTGVHKTGQYYEAHTPYQRNNYNDYPLHKSQLLNKVFLISSIVPVTVCATTVVLSLCFL
jgi:hypothetical protein